MPDKLSETLAKFRDLAAVRSSLRRRWFEQRLRAVRPEAKGAVVHLGSEYGGWTVPDGLIDDTWTCWCVGAGSDVSFDLALIERFGARVRSFDPFHIFREQAEEKADGSPRYSFHELAIATADGPLTMWGAQDEVLGSVSAENLYGVQSSFVRPGRTLASLKAELGDARIDLLKLDVEGSEYDVLDHTDLDELGVKVLCVELHHTVGPERALALFGRLRSEGFQVVHRAGGADFTLLRTAGVRATSETSA